VYAGAAAYTSAAIGGGTAFVFAFIGGFTGGGAFAGDLAGAGATGSADAEAMTSANRDSEGISQFGRLKKIFHSYFEKKKCDEIDGEISSMKGGPGGSQK
jgi:hypothetical protein